MARKTLTKMTPKQGFDIISMIRERADTTDGAVYHEGWDDKRIAKELGVPVDSVTYRREKVFPRKPPEPVAPLDAEKEIADLKQRVEALEARLARLDKSQTVLPFGKVGS